MLSNGHTNAHFFVSILCACSCIVIKKENTLGKSALVELKAKPQLCMLTVRHCLILAIYIRFIKGDSNIIFVRVPLCLHDGLLFWCEEIQVIFVYLTV